jgi:hypothetical protein
MKVDGTMTWTPVRSQIPRIRGNLVAIRIWCWSRRACVTIQRTKGPASTGTGKGCPKIQCGSPIIRSQRRRAIRSCGGVSGWRNAGASNSRVGRMIITQYSPRGPMSLAQLIMLRNWILLSSFRWASGVRMPRRGHGGVIELDQTMIGHLVFAAGMSMAGSH